MFGTIRRHQKWLWLVIITFTVISFVIYFSPYSKINRERVRPMNLGTIDGHKISDEAMSQAVREMQLMFLLRNGRAMDEESRKNLERESLQWLLLTQKQEQLGIHISSQMVAEVARNMLRSMRGMENMSPEGIARLLEKSGFQLDDLERYVRHYLGLQELMATVAVGGKLATPEQIQDLYVSEHQELATEAVFFNASNYLARVSVTPEALNTFYSNSLAVYRIPKRVQVSYVKFPLTNFWTEAEQFLAKTNLNENVEDTLRRIGTNYDKVPFFKDVKTPEQARARIREEIIRGRALFEAHSQANEFVRPLLDAPVQHPDDLDKAAKAQTNGLTVAVTEPFDNDHEPKGVDAGEDFLNAAFRLTPDQPLASPIDGNDGVYVIAYKNNLPAEYPPLDKIRDQVAADYKSEQAKALAQQAAIAFHSSLTNGIAQGKSFAAFCAAAKVSPTPLPPFSLSTRALPEIEESVSLGVLKNAAFTTAVGKASNVQGTSDGALILFVKSKVPLDRATMTKELPAFAQGLRERWQTEAFNEWFSEQFTRSVRPPYVEEKSRRRPTSPRARRPTRPERASTALRSRMGTMNRTGIACREAFWTAPVLWRFLERGDAKAAEDCRTPKPCGLGVGSWKPGGRAA